MDCPALPGGHDVLFAAELDDVLNVSTKGKGCCMRTMMWVCLGLTLSAPAFSNTDASRVIPNERTLREACSAYSEAGMRDCLAAKARESYNALVQVENQLRAALSRWDEDAKHIRLAQAKLAASDKAFIQYRDAQCAFAASLGGGAIGNALEMRRFACIAELNHRRAKLLHDALSGFPSK
jgi:uncharacterized protein YecT (DUF1311 family)